MYIRSFLRGLDPLPSDPHVRARLLRRWEEEGGGVLHRELSDVDPASAALIHASDRVRVLRALEVAEITGEPPSARKGSWARGNRYRVLFLVLSVDRAALYRRIDSRVDAMFSGGLVEEVIGLLAKGYGRALPSMGALGYRHVLFHILDGVSREEAAFRMKRDTRRYAKRQIAWLSGEAGTVSLSGSVPRERAAEEVRKFLF